MKYILIAAIACASLVGCKKEYCIKCTENGQVVSKCSKKNANDPIFQDQFRGHDESLPCK